MLNWDSLQSACLSCTRCPLSQTRHHVVFGVGPQDAEVLFVGEGPGENEDLQGEPFVGAAGKFLDEMLTIIDLGRHNCYITNIIKYTGICCWIGARCTSNWLLINFYQLINIF